MERYYQLLLIVTTLAIIALMIKNQFLVQEIGKKKQGSESQLSTATTIKEINLQTVFEKIKMEFPELEPYTKYQAKVILLEQSKLEELSAKQPVIYKDLDAPLYKIEFSKDDGGSLLILYNPYNDKIVRKFEILGMSV